MTELDNYYNELILLSGKVVIAISILTLIFGLFQWQKFNKTIKIFCYYLLVALVLYWIEPVFYWSVSTYTDAWRPILKALNISDTNFIRYPYHINNFTLLGWFLYRTLLPRPLAKWVKWLSVLLVILVTINYFFIQGHNVAGGFNSTVSAMYCFLLPLLSMWYLYHSDNKVPLVHHPYFWINLGLIIPSLIGLFLYFAGNAIYTENYPLYAQLTIAKNGIEFIAQILTAIGFYYARNVKYIDSL